MVYLLAAIMAQGSDDFRHGILPMYPDWLFALGVASAFAAMAVQVYLYRTGYYDEENPMLKSREAFRREMIASRKGAARHEREPTH